MATLVELDGELDAAAAGWIRTRLRDAAEPGAHVVLDLGRVTFVDAAGLGALVGFVRSQRESGGAVRVVRASRPVRRVFELTGMERLLAGPVHNGS